MQLAHKKRNTLLQHKTILERSLRDLVAGKATGHLADEELNQMVVGLRSRLAAVCVALESSK
jgi:hypothetical protein